MPKEFRVRGFSPVRMIIVVVSLLTFGSIPFLIFYSEMFFGGDARNAWWYFFLGILVDLSWVISLLWIGVTKIRFTEGGIYYRTLGLAIQSSWDNLERVARRPVGFGVPRYEFVLHHDADGKVAWYQAVFSRYARKRIPISPFACWPDDEMLPLLEQYAPQVVVDWRKNTLRP